MSYRLTILGCGSSGGVPRIGSMWGACDPDNPRNRRRRCSALVERLDGGRRTAVLIDTSPDLREQLLSVRCDALDGVLYTHDHADHSHGIDDLRMVAYSMKRRIEIHADPVTRLSLLGRFGYCFETPPGSSYSPILKAREINGIGPVRIEGAAGAVEALAVPQLHGDISSLGFRIRGVAYSPDVSGLTESSRELLRGLDVWILDALRYTAHPSHLNVKQALELIEEMKPARAILTHMTADLDYDALRRALPPNVEPAYDGMVVEFE